MTPDPDEQFSVMANVGPYRPGNVVTRGQIVALGASVADWLRGGSIVPAGMKTEVDAEKRTREILAEAS